VIAVNKFQESGVIDFLTAPTRLGFLSRRRLRGIALHDGDITEVLVPEV
jgi:hypothetical protein